MNAISRVASSQLMVSGGGSRLSLGKHLPVMRGVQHKGAAGELSIDNSQSYQYMSLNSNKNKGSISLFKNEDERHNVMK